MTTTINTPITVSAEGVSTFRIDGETALAVREYLRLANLKREVEDAEKAAREAVDVLFPDVEDGMKQIVEIDGLVVLSRKPFYRDGVPIAAIREHAPEVFLAWNKPVRIAAWKKA